jgi:molybdenum cofactor biosynthesis enzyme MoaA
MRKDELLRAAALGARISINVPSTVPDTYRRLTGGDFGLLTAVLCGLRDSAAVCAINSYSGLSPDEREIRSMMDFADTYQCDLKLLLPCQITSPTRQENARSAYRRVLEELGCEHRADTHYDSTWVAAGGGTVRLVVPFCPNA